MTKTTNTRYVCQNCGASTIKWQGRCDQCQKWNTLVEEITPKKVNRKSIAHTSSNAIPINKDIELSVIRTKTNMNELDRVLGGGLVSGSYTLLGGPPGIGKSTLLLQISAKLSTSGSVLYVCSEESVNQTSLRAKRLNIQHENIFLLNESILESILEKTKQISPKFLIVDSIQSIYLSELDSAPGTVSQIKECSYQLMNFAKSTNTCVLIIGHITKDGALAGPKLLEHVVDTVLSFEGHTHYRILKSLKNRFGATNELGIFQMTDKGLEEIKNPSEFFLEERGKNAIGSAVFTAIEGRRPLLCEIQALTVPSFLAMPRRVSIGIDIHRLHMILAVLEKNFQTKFSKYDIFLNIAGGLKITEPASDLATAASLLSSYYKKALSMQSCFFGEIGLTGEVRSCPYREERIREASKLGFQTVYLPSNKKQLKTHQKIKRVEMDHIQHLSSFFKK